MQHGGKRINSGRKPKSPEEKRNKVNFYVTIKEKELIKEFIKKIRGNQNDIPAKWISKKILKEHPEWDIKNLPTLDKPRSKEEMQKAYEKTYGDDI